MKKSGRTDPPEDVFEADIHILPGDVNLWMKTARWELVDRPSAKGADVEFLPFESKPPAGSAELYAWVNRSECWMRRDIGDEWIAAYRLVPQEGTPIVAELRIFPRGEGAFPRDPGLWNGDFLGMGARAPKGGLGARTLRSVRLGIDKRVSRDVLAAFREMPGGESLLEFLGLPALKSRRPKGSRRGRKPTPVAKLAAVAETYSAAVARRSRSPIEDTAAQHSLTVGQVRSYIYKAREKGILSKTRWGSAGGRLTLKGKRLLEGESRRKSAKGRAK